MASIVRSTVADLVMTFLWVIYASTLGIQTATVATFLGLQGNALAGLAITTALVAVLVVVFEVVGGLLGGASFNPTGTASFYAAGVGDGSLVVMAFRFPAQALGAIGGALAVVEFMPARYKHMIGGPYLKVDPHTGAIAEGVLTFAISFAVLWIVVRGPKSPIIKTLLISICTVAVVVTGHAYTGPSLNPANAFGWAYINNKHNTWEQFYVYWICPFIGSILASLAFRLVFSPPAPKVKKA